MFCDKCGTEIVGGQTKCPNCGTDVRESSKKINPIIHIILGILIVAVVAGIVTMLITTRVSYKEQQLDVKEDIAASAEASEEVLSPNIQKVDMSIVSKRVSAPAVEAEQEELQTESEYIFEDSNERFLEAEEIYALTEEEMRIARNEIYARLGRKFTDETLQEYFESKSWYTPIYEAEEFDSMGDDIFNEYEFANKDLISEIESELGYR